MSEKKNIDADWLSHWIDKNLNAYRIIKDCRDGKAIYDFIKNVLVPIVKTAPAADVAEIVRCKDCKHWHGGDCFRIELTRPNDFCSCGEKIKEE